VPSALRGVAATPVTPFTADDRVDWPTFERLVDFLIEQGAQLLAVPLHIGESLNLSLEERKTLAEAAVKTAAGRVPVIINVGLPATGHVVELARHAERAGADAVIAIAPYHWAPPREGLLAHFSAIASAVGINVLAYNFPRKIGVTLTTDFLVELIERFGHFAGLKDASYDMQYFTEACRVTRAARPEFAIFTGVEYLLPSMVVGGAGSFSACGAIAPGLVRSLYEACAGGSLERAQALQYTLSQLWQVLSAGYPASIKAAMALMGRPAGQPRLPITPLGEDQVARLRTKLEQLGVLEREPFGWSTAHAGRA